MFEWWVSLLAGIAAVVVTGVCVGVLLWHRSQLLGPAEGRVRLAFLAVAGTAMMMLFVGLHLLASPRCVDLPSPLGIISFIQLLNGQETCPIQGPGVLGQFGGWIRFLGPVSLVVGALFVLLLSLIVFLRRKVTSLWTRRGDRNRMRAFGYYNAGEDEWAAREASTAAICYAIARQPVASKVIDLERQLYQLFRGVQHGNWDPLGHVEEMECLASQFEALVVIRKAVQKADCEPEHCPVKRAWPRFFAFLMIRSMDRVSEQAFDHLADVIRVCLATMGGLEPLVRQRGEATALAAFYRLAASMVAQDKVAPIEGATGQLGEYRQPVLAFQESICRASSEHSRAAKLRLVQALPPWPDGIAAIRWPISPHLEIDRQHYENARTLVELDLAFDDTFESEAESQTVRSQPCVQVVALGRGGGTWGARHGQRRFVLTKWIRLLPGGALRRHHQPRRTVGGHVPPRQPSSRFLAVLIARMEGSSETAWRIAVSILRPPPEILRARGMASRTTRIEYLNALMARFA